MAWKNDPELEFAIANSTERRQDSGISALQGFPRAFVLLTAESKTRRKISNKFSGTVGRNSVTGAFHDGRLDAEIVRKRDGQFKQINLSLERGDFGEVCDIRATLMTGVLRAEPMRFETFGLHNPENTMSSLQVMNAIRMVSKVARN